MKALLFNPPGGLFQRGEDRCQADIEGSATVTLRPPNDLGYMAALLREIGVEPLLRDYPARGEDYDQLIRDCRDFLPNLAILSSTVGTVKDDMRAFQDIKRILPSTITIAKGAPFQVYTPETFNHSDYKAMDFALREEVEASIVSLISAIREKRTAGKILGVLAREEGGFACPGPTPWIEDLDSIPFPARDLMDNHLYTLPNGNSLATIQISRGCPGRCIYCLTPRISGNKLRQRSPDNVIAELKECVEKYKIHDFFFRADTFTLNKKFVIRLCRAILANHLPIHWVANSRSDTLDEEMLQWMKKAGCRLIALGIESGSENTLRKSKKGISREDSIKAVRLIKKSGIKVYGFFMIGFPWETKEDIEQTMDFAAGLKCDFSEVHITSPYPGTELYKIAGEMNLMSGEELGYNYFSNPPIGTRYLSREQLLYLRKKFLRRLYLNPGYIVRTIIKADNWMERLAYAKRGLKVFQQVFR